MLSPTPHPDICSRCGAAMTCDIEAGHSSCWCFDLPVLRRKAEDVDGCLCKSCLAALVAEDDHNPNIRT